MTALLAILTNRYVLYVVGSLALMAGGYFAWQHYVAEPYRQQGRVEIQTKFDAYKTKVTAAAEAAQKAVDILAAQHLATAAAASSKFDRQTVVINQTTQEAKRVIESAPMPDCALPDGVRDAINTARRGAAASVSGSYEPQGAVRETGRDERQVREPRGAVR
jgi:hypothetical protein